MSYCPKCWFPITVNAECICDLCGWFGGPNEVLDKPGDNFNLTHSAVKTLALYRDTCRGEILMESLYAQEKASLKDLQDSKRLVKDMVHALIEMFVKVKIKPFIPEVVLCKYPNGFLPWPTDWKDRRYNACNEPCDMLIGPCACGAWHYEAEEWVQIKLLEHLAIIVDDSHD